jgi:site-specific DNA-cytosine methylase
VAGLRSVDGDAAHAHGAGLQGRDERAERARKWVVGARLCERYWPIPDAWIHRVDDGVPARSHRLKALGNSVVPQVVEVIGRAIMAAEYA